MIYGIFLNRGVLGCLGVVQVTLDGGRQVRVKAESLQLQAPRSMGYLGGSK